LLVVDSHEPRSSDVGSPFVYFVARTVRGHASQVDPFFLFQRVEVPR